MDRNKMADVFISYAREDILRIEPIVTALEQQGFSVFWDRQIPPRQPWRSYISQELEKAGCVVAAWTVNSIASHFVAEEADEGNRRNILVPVLLDSVEPPFGFRSIQSHDLTDWKSTDPLPKFDQLIDDINAVLKATQNSYIKDTQTANLTHHRLTNQHLNLFKGRKRQWLFGILITIIAMVFFLIILQYDLKLAEWNRNRNNVNYEQNIGNEDAILKEIIALSVVNSKILELTNNVLNKNVTTNDSCTQYEREIKELQSERFERFGKIQYQIEFIENKKIRDKLLKEFRENSDKYISGCQSMVKKHCESPGSVDEKWQKHQEKMILINRNFEEIKKALYREKDWKAKDENKRLDM